jgi:Tol biopolymer transport system component
MKAKNVFFGLAIIIILTIRCSVQPKTGSEIKPFDYFGQTPPSDSAVLFTAELISDTSKKTSTLAISLNGDEVFFSFGIWPNTIIMQTTKSGNKWSKPDTAVFLKNTWATEPSFSPDGKYLYFSSSKGKTVISDYSLFRSEKKETGWSEPEICFDAGGDSIWEFHPTITRDGSLYFCYWNSKTQSGDIYMSKSIENKFSEPVKMEEQISTDSSDVDPFAGPDGDYIIFASNRSGGYGGFDQYIAFKNNDGSWTKLKNMGKKFNTEKDNYDIDISPDGKYVFEYLNNHIYWRPVGNIFSD